MKRTEKSAGKKKKPARKHNNHIQTEQEQATKTAAPSPTVRLAPATTESRSEENSFFKEEKRLFLGVGDEVTHLRYEQWGIGVVMECMTSSVPGGTCLARIRFQDGILRCFNNDLDNDSCCYYFGLRRYWNPTHGVNAIRSNLFMRG
ncbi:MAG TPA: hypothetical protein VF353_06060 [Candidatus Binatia bacterium]